MKPSSVSATIAFLLTIAFGAPLGAGETPSPTPYSGDLWSRSTLSGDWWGFRNELATKGVTLDMSLTQAAQGVHGGKETGWQYSGGRGDIILNVDTQDLASPFAPVSRFSHPVSDLRKTSSRGCSNA